MKKISFFISFFFFKRKRALDRALSASVEFNLFPAIADIVPRNCCHAQNNSYVLYARQHYEMISSFQYTVLKYIYVLHVLGELGGKLVCFIRIDVMEEVRWVVHVEYSVQ